MTTKPKSTHGGPRPGSGAKVKPGRKVDRKKPVYLFTDQNITPPEVRQAVDEYLTKKNLQQ